MSHKFSSRLRRAESYTITAQPLFAIIALSSKTRQRATTREVTVLVATPFVLQQPGFLKKPGCSWPNQITPRGSYVVDPFRSGAYREVVRSLWDGATLTNDSSSQFSRSRSRQTLATYTNPPNYGEFGYIDRPLSDRLETTE